MFPSLPHRARRISLLTRAAAFGLATTLAACGGSSFDDAVTVAGYNARCGLPAPSSEKYRVTPPTGSFCVGASIVHAEDAARLDVMGPDPARARSVQLRVWYPAADAKGVARLPYSDEAHYASQGWPDPAAKPNGNALNNAPAASNARFPVLLFSPGMGFPVNVYAGIAEDLASHGYIVVGINHPLTSGPVTLADGRVIGDFEDLSVANQARLADLMVQDQRFVLDWLEKRQAGEALPFSAVMDLRRIGAYGHSIGGSAALQASRLDARVKAGVNMDGTVWGDLSTPWAKPWMILYGGREIDDSYALFAANPRPDSILASIPTAGHHDFSDIPRWMEIFRKTLPAAQLPTEADVLHPDPAALERRLREDVRRFFDQHVKQ